jgi:HK97 family phage prohead protease
MEAERRYQPAGEDLEIRADLNGNISGYAAVFYTGEANTEFGLWEGARERIAPGAFQRAISERDDARALFNHEPDKLLGRVSAGTLLLEEDGRGLHYSINLGNTSIAKDVKEMIGRGDLTGSSFSFKVTEEEWTEEEGTQIRNIKGVQLFDVGPVTFPAYDASTVKSRDIQGAKDSKEEHEREKLKKRVNERIDELAGENEPEGASEEAEKPS